MPLMLRSPGGPMQSVQSVKDVVRILDPNLPMLRTMAYEDFYMDRAVKGPRIAMDLVGSMGVAGPLPAIPGLYGVGGLKASARTGRIGLCPALAGAQPQECRAGVGQ